MSDDKYLYDGYYGQYADEGSDKAEKVSTPRISVTELGVIHIMPNEVLIVKYDTENTTQHEADQWAKAFRNYLSRMFNDDVASRFIMIPSDWVLEKARLDIKPKEHPLYEEKTTKTED